MLIAYREAKFYDLEPERNENRRSTLVKSNHLRFSLNLYQIAND